MFRGMIRAAPAGSFFFAHISSHFLSGPKGGGTDVLLFSSQQWLAGPGWGWLKERERQVCLVLRPSSWSKVIRMETLTFCALSLGP